MTQAEYNTKVQDIQSMWSDDHSRFGTHRNKDGLIKEAYFEVYWDGIWHVLGQQKNPFTPEASYDSYLSG